MDNRFNLPTQPRKYEVTSLRARHHEIIRLIVIGLENTEISELLGVEPQTVSNVRNSSLARQQIEMLKAQRDAESIDVAQRIRELGDDSIFVVGEMVERTKVALRSDPDMLPSALAISVAQDILNRAGHQPPKQVERHVHAHLTGQDLARIKGSGVCVEEVEAEVLGD